MTPDNENIYNEQYIFTAKITIDHFISSAVRKSCDRKIQHRNLSTESCKIHFLQNYFIHLQIIKFTTSSKIKKRSLYQSIAPDDTESLITSQRSLNAKAEKPFHVSRHPPHKTNKS